MAASPYQYRSHHSGLDFSNARRSTFYASPQTPSTAGTPHTSGGHAQTSSSVSRKRQRASHSPAKTATRVSYISPSASGYETPGLVTPAPFANEHYRLENGHDTPTEAQAAAYSRPTSPENSSLPQRGRRGPAGGSDRAYDHHTPSSLDPIVHRHDGRPCVVSRLQTDYVFPPRKEDWSTTVLNTVTGLAGFVFNFCTAGAFRGFYGKHDKISIQTPRYGSEDELSRSKHVADSWHDSDFAQDELPPSPSYNRAVKKMKTIYSDGGGLKSNWIMVEGAGCTSVPGSPSRGGSPSPYTATHQGSPSLASPAGLRRAPGPIKPVTLHRRRTTIGLAPVSGVRAASNATLRSPGKDFTGGHGGRASRPSSTRASDGAFVDAPSSPLGEEGERLIRVREKRQRQEDRELTRMNRRLEDMIRQGREALGTKVDIVEWDD